MNYVRLRKLTTNYSFESCITKIKSIFAETLNSWNGVVLNVRERIQVKTSLLDQPLVAIRLSWYGLVLLQAFYIGWSGPNVGSWTARMRPNEYILKATRGGRIHLSYWFWYLLEYYNPFNVNTIYWISYHTDIYSIKWWMLS